jgi:hypothetical protein
MGGEARLVAFDIDGEEGRTSLARLEGEHEPLPPTLSQVTGRIEGGEHRLFRVPAHLEIDYIRNRVKLAPGIDVRAEGGLIVAPPSMHPTGTRYRWIDENQLVAAVPDWLFRLATSPRARQEVISTHGSRPAEELLPPLAERIEKARAALLSSKVEPAIQGQNGSRACLHAAILLIRGYCLPPPTVYDLLWQLYNPICLPPWSEQELMHKIESAELHVDVAWGYAVYVYDPSPVGRVIHALRLEAEREAGGIQSEAQALWTATKETVWRPETPTAAVDRVKFEDDFFGDDSGELVEDDTYFDED